MASSIYNNYKSRLLSDLTTGTVKVMLTNGYTYNSSHQFRSSITNEVTGTGYTAGGITLTGKSVSISGSTATFTASNPTWSNATFTFNGFVVYIDTGTPSTSPVVGYYPVSPSQSPAGQSITIDIATMLGLIDLT
jgi:hypothetical protein